MKRRFIKIAFLAIVITSVLGGITMLLWNILMPAIFGLTTINFWQALGLFVLVRILFGGFGKSKMMMHNRMNAMWNNPVHEKWMKMTPEQRKEFIEKRRKSGFGDPFGRDHFNMHGHEEHKKEDEQGD